MLRGAGAGAGKGNTVHVVTPELADADAGCKSHADCEQAPTAGRTYYGVRVACVLGGSMYVRGRVFLPSRGVSCCAMIMV